MALSCPGQMFFGQPELHQKSMGPAGPIFYIAMFVHQSMPNNPQATACA